MNLRWNGTLRRFEAEFSADFQGDLAAVKAAGFKTNGAPGWIWHTSKAGPLTKLRTLRAGLLTISPEARAQYILLAAMDEKNAIVKAQLQKVTKERKKKEKINAPSTEMIVPEKGYIDASDLPPLSCLVQPYIPPPPPETKCIICGVPVYFYELQNPPVCLWDEKIVLDKSDFVC